MLRAGAFTGPPPGEPHLPESPAQVEEMAEAAEKTLETAQVETEELAPADRDGWLSAMREAFRDRMVKAGTVILALMLALVIFAGLSDLPVEHPLFGVFLFSLVPVLFISGAAIFFICILKLER